MHQARGVLNKFLYGEAPPRGPTPLPFYIPFFTKEVLLSYTFYWQMVPLSHASFRASHPFHLLFFALSINHKNRKFSRLYKAIKFICSALWGLSQTQMTDFPTLLYTSTIKIPTLSNT